MHDSKESIDSGSEVTYPIVEIAGCVGKHETMNEASREGGDMMTIEPQVIDRIGRCIFNVHFHTFYAVYANLFNHQAIGYVKEKYGMMTNNTSQYLCSHYKEFSAVLVAYENATPADHKRTRDNYEAILDQLRTVAL